MAKTTNEQLKAQLAAMAAANGELVLLDVAGTKYFRQQLDKRYIAASQKGANNGVATLDANGKLTASQTPLGLDEYIEVDVLPTTNRDHTTFYYVKTGGTGEDADKDGNIVKGTAGHTYRFILNLEAEGDAPKGYWVDISEVDTAKKAVADDKGNTISTTYATKNELNTGLGKKVDAVAGKGLSTNDYTTDEKNKLASLKNYTLPVAGDNLGGIKNGGNVVVGDDGTANVELPEVPNVRAMTNAEIDAAFTD